MEPALAKRVALLQLIELKVQAYGGRRGVGGRSSDEGFFIDEGRATGWGKAVSITSSFFTLHWGAAQDLLLLRLVLRHGYGHWRRYLSDRDFLRNFPPEMLKGGAAGARAGAGNGGGRRGGVGCRGRRPPPPVPPWPAPKAWPAPEGWW